MLQAKSDWNSSKINSMINVLLVFANPSDTHALRLQTEEKVIRDAIRRSNHRDKIILTICPAATIHDVRHAFLDSDKKVQIVQISGHGSTEGLFLENELGERKVVPKKALADFIQEYCPPIKCVILNACYSASQGRLIFGVPYTIIMEGPIDDEAAIEFSRGFYDAIGAGKSIEFAFGEGCRTVRLTIPNPNFVPELLKKGSVRDEGDRHYAAKRYEEALSKYEKAIQSDLHDAYAWYRKGDSLLKLERYEEALVACEHSLLIKSNSADALNSRGEALLFLGRYEEALATYDKAIELNTLDGSFYNNKGFVLVLLKHYKKALAAYDQAIQLDPTNADFYLNKGRALTYLKYHQKALLTYEQAILFAPGVPLFHIARGNALYQLKHYEEALAAFGKAIELDSNNAEAYWWKGAVLLIINRLNEAAIACKQSIKLNPNSAVAHEINKMVEEAFAAQEQV